MNITKRQKIKVLKLMYKHIVEDKEEYLCIAFHYAVNEIGIDLFLSTETEYDMMRTFGWHRPKDAIFTGWSYHWWESNNRKPRLALITRTLHKLNGTGKNSVGGRPKQLKSGELSKRNSAGL